MFSDISAGGWLVVLSALALGFGLVRFLVVSMRDSIEKSTPKQENSSARPSGFGTNYGERASHAGNSRKTGTESDPLPKAWHDILGVKSNASLDQIRTAYRKKMALYHPDKVASLGAEFSVIAERMTKEINEAYERGIAARS